MPTVRRSAAGGAASPPGGDRRRYRVALLVGLKLALAAVILLFAYRMAAGFDWSDLGIRLRSAEPWTLVAAVAFLVGRYVVWQYRWSLIAGRIDRTGFALRRYAAVTASVLVNHLTPSVRVFGGLLRARYLSRGGERPFVAHYGAVLFEQIVHQLVFAILLWLAVLVLAWSFGQVAVALALLAAGTLLLAYLLRRRAGRGSGSRLLFRLAAGSARLQSRRLAPLATRGRELVAVLRDLFGDRALWGPAASLTLLFGVLNITAQWLLFRSLSAEVGVVTLVAVVSAGWLVGALAGTPGGVATTEAAMTAGYVALGVGEIEAAAATLLYRGLHYAVVLGSGLPSLFYFEVLERKRGLRDRDPHAPGPAPDSAPPDDGSPPRRAG